MRHRKKPRQAQADVNEPVKSEYKPPDLYQGKPELDDEQHRQEMEAQRERCVLDGQDSRQELTAEQLDNTSERGSTLQKPRGLESSSELAAGHEVAVKQS